MNGLLSLCEDQCGASSSPALFLQNRASLLPCTDPVCHSHSATTAADPRSQAAPGCRSHLPVCRPVLSLLPYNKDRFPADLPRSQMRPQPPHSTFLTDLPSPGSSPHPPQSAVSPFRLHALVSHKRCQFLPHQCQAASPDGTVPHPEGVRPSPSRTYSVPYGCLQSPPSHPHCRVSCLP